MKRTDIAIIGGGMPGCAAAWFLAKQNIGQVTLFERNTLASAATGRGAGIFCVVRPHPGERQMVRDTLTDTAPDYDISFYHPDRFGAFDPTHR